MLSNKNLRSYAINVFNGMALGLFASLIIGLILKQLGAFLSIPILEHFGKIAQLLMAPAIGAGVALSVKSPPLGVFAASIAAFINSSIPFPVLATMGTTGTPKSFDNLLQSILSP